jgi:hypothetical protein
MTTFHNSPLFQLKHDSLLYFYVGNEFNEDCDGNLQFRHV